MSENNQSPESEIPHEIAHLDFSPEDPEIIASNLLNPVDKQRTYPNSEFPYGTKEYKENFLATGGYQPGENYFTDRDNGVESGEEPASHIVRIASDSPVDPNTVIPRYRPPQTYKRYSAVYTELAAEAEELHDEAFLWAEKQELSLVDDRAIDQRVTALYKVYKDAESGIEEARLAVALAKRTAQQAEEMLKAGVSVALIPKETEEIIYKYYNGIVLSDMVTTEVNQLTTSVIADVQKRRRVYTDRDFRSLLVLMNRDGKVLPGARDTEYTEF